MDHKNKAFVDVPQHGANSNGDFGPCPIPGIASEVFGTWNGCNLRSERNVESAIRQYDEAIALAGGVGGQ